MTRQVKYSIRKSTMGVASIAIATLLTGQAHAQAQEQFAQPTTEQPSLIQKQSFIGDTSINQIQENPIVESDTITDAVEPNKYTDSTIDSMVTDQTITSDLKISEENATESHTNIDTNLNIQNNVSIQETTVDQTLNQAQMTSPLSVENQANETVVVNEADSKDQDGGPDWAELYNPSDVDVDISGYYVFDNKNRDKGTESFPFAENTFIGPEQFFLLEEGTHFTFGLGKEDSVRLFDQNDQLISELSWTDGHAQGSYGRSQDGGTDVVDLTPTKNAPNQTKSENTPVPVKNTPSPIGVNEADSKDQDGGPDWAELYNNSDQEVNISGYYVFDSDERDLGNEAIPLPANTIIAPRGFFLLEEGTHFTFGLGKEDSVRLFDQNKQLISELSWTGGHALGSYGRSQDGGTDVVDLTPTKNASNQAVNLASEILINEVDSAPADFIELINMSQGPIDLSGYEVRDSEDDHRFKIDQSTVIDPGAFFVIDETLEGLNYDNQQGYIPGKLSFGIGSSDKIRLFNSDGKLIDELSWEKHASHQGDETLATIGRDPQDMNQVVIMQPTKGQENALISPQILINEVETSDPNNGPDWIEFYNDTDNPINLKDYILKDSKDDHAYTFNDFLVNPKAYKVVTDDDFNFGLGKEDSVRLFKDNTLVAEISWRNGHAPETFGRTQDGQYANTSEATPGSQNKFEETVVNPWPGIEEVTIIDDKPTFLEDSSGLDFHDGALYAVDNGTGTFWKFLLDENHQLSIDPGWESGKRVRFQKDAKNPEAKGPDAEGITLNNDGMVFVAAERDNSEKAVNFNVLLKVDPNQTGPDLISLKEWDLTPLLPEVSANMGIEAVEFVSSDALINKLYDNHMQGPYNPANYQDSESQGLFFVALEDNGHVYAFNLASDGSATQIADIDTQIGGAMALDYDKDSGILWVSSDNGYEGVLTQIQLNGQTDPIISHIRRPNGLVIDNHEGFAIAPDKYAKDDIKPAFWFTDGLTEKALKMGGLRVQTEPLTLTPSPDANPPQLPPFADDLQPTPREELPEDTHDVIVSEGNDSEPVNISDVHMDQDNNPSEAKQYTPPKFIRMVEAVDTHNAEATSSSPILPNTGESQSPVWFTGAALSIITSMGLIVSTRKND